MTKLNVILPAAGKGSRLNLPYPKEILRFDKERALIDSSFDLFKKYSRNEVQFSVIINEDKTEIVKYLSKYKSQFNINFTYQNPEEKEYTGAIKSAQYLFGDNNLVLLPDTIITLPNKVDLLKTLIDNLNQDSFTFLFKSERSAEVLKSKGCLQLDDNGSVIGYEDKPCTDTSMFSGYWCAFAFKKRIFDDCIAFMEQSTFKKRKRPIKIDQTAIFKSKVIKVDSYVDLGTWEAIGKLFSDSYTE